MSSGGLREILEYTLEEEKLVNKLCDRLFAIDVNVRSIGFRDVTDAQEVITQLSLAIWDEFEREFLQFVNDNNFDIDEEGFCIEVDESDYEKAQALYPQRYIGGKECMCGILYRQAGNSIVVPVLQAIVRELKQYF